MLSCGSLFFRMVFLWRPCDFPYVILEFSFHFGCHFASSFYLIWGHVGVDFGVILGSCWGHVGVSERVAFQVRKSAPKVLDLGAQVEPKLASKLGQDAIKIDV